MAIMTRRSVKNDISSVKAAKLPKNKCKEDVKLKEIVKLEEGPQIQAQNNEAENVEKADHSNPNEKPKKESEQDIKPKKRVKQEESEEVDLKRPKRWRGKLPKATLSRVNRALMQPMYLVDRTLDSVSHAQTFSVLGSTGNRYEVHINTEPSCDCPDFNKRKDLCKHLIFVMLRVLGLPQESELWYQRGLLAEEVKHLARNKINDKLLADTRVRAAITGKEEAPVSETRRQPQPGDICPICFEGMQLEDKLEYDDGDGGCGGSVHSSCLQKWMGSQKEMGRHASCPYCRHAIAFIASAPSTEGQYQNYAAMAGMSRIRDTSTYYRPPVRGRGWRGRIRRYLGRSSN